MPYNSVRVVAFLSTLGRELAARAPQLANVIRQTLQREIAATAARAAVAEAISQAATRSRFYVPSSGSIGSHVHNVVQGRYVRMFGGIHDIAIERYDYDQRVTVNQVIGPSTLGNAEPLSVIAGSRRDPDRFWYCLRYSLAGTKIYHGGNSWLRADLVDHHRYCIWEIKPVGSLASGVWQEALYRNSFNMYRLFFFGAAPSLRSMELPILERGANPFNPVGMGDAGGFSVTTVVNLSSVRGVGRGKYAFPFYTPVLDGMIPYIVLRAPGIAEVIPLALMVLSQVWRDLERRLREIAREIDGQMSQVGVRAVRALQKAVEQAEARAQRLQAPRSAIELLFLVLFFLALLVAVFVRPLPVVQPGAGGVFVGPAGSSGPVASSYLPGAPPSVTFFRGIYTLTYTPREDETRALTTLAMPGALIHNLPVDAIASVFDAHAAALDSLSRACGRRLSEVGRRSRQPDVG